MGFECAVYGGDDFGKDVGIRLESLVNDAVDERPEFFFEGRVSGAGGNEDDFMVFGKIDRKLPTGVTGFAELIEKTVMPSN